MKNNYISKLVVSALLCAIGIIIPMFSPIKFIMEPASFTLGSHIAIMIAMFISPTVAVAVSLGTTFGFLLGGFPIVVVFRASTHVIFAFIGALILKKHPAILSSVPKSTVFSLGIALIHSVCELAIVTPFFFGNTMADSYYAKGFVFSVLLMVGVGTVVHSMVDFAISYVIFKAVRLSNGGKRPLIATK